MLASALTPGHVETQPQPRGSTTLRGHVVDTAGKSVPYVYVYERTTERFVVTDPEGWFILALPAQRQPAISARRIGYQSLDMQLDPKSDRGKLLRLVLMPGTDAARGPSRPTGYSESLDRFGYYRRMTQAIDATFMTSDQIARRSSNETVTLLDDVAGINVVSRGGSRAKSSIAVSNSGCTLGIVIDGRRVEDQALPPSVSGAIEVYPRAAAIPEELRHQAKGCGLIVIWDG